MDKDTPTENTNLAGLSWIDGVKAICIPLFIYSHVQKGLYWAGIGQFEDIFHVIDRVIRDALYPTLFFVFGYQLGRVLSQDVKSVWFKSTLDNIFHLYIIWSVLQGLVQFAFAIATGRDVSFLDIFAIGWLPLEHFGILYALFFGLLISYSILRKSSEKSASRVILISLGLCLYFVQSWLTSAWLMDKLAPYFIFLLTGVLLSKRLNPGGNVSAALLLPVMVLFGVAQYIFHHLPELNIYLLTSVNLLVSSISIMLIVALGSALVFVSTRISRGQKVITSLSVMLLPIYAMHMIPGHGTRILMSLGLGMQNNVMHLMVGCILAFILPVLFYLSCSRLRWTALLLPSQNIKLSSIVTYVSGFFRSRPKLRLLALANGLLLSVSLIVLFVLSELRIHAQYEGSFNMNYSEISLLKDPQSIENGRRLSRILGCSRGCHGGDLTGGTKFEVENYGTVYSRNLSAIIQQYTLAELERAIRFGVSPDNQFLSTVMPSLGFFHLKQTELEEVLSYLATMTPLASSPPENHFSLADRFAIISQGIDTTVDILAISYDPAEEIVYQSEGERLAKMICSECHGATLSGTDIGPSLLVARAYNLEQFQHLMSTGMGLGERELGLMSVISQLRLSFLTEAEVQDIYRYLSTQLE